MINVLVSVNTKFIDYLKVMICTLHNTTEGEICIYLCNRDLKKSEIDQIGTFLSKKCKRVKLVTIDMKDNSPFESFPIVTHNFSVEMYYRLLAQFVLPESIERVLWLDSDIVILKDISDFYYQDFNDKYMIACPDISCDSEKFVNHKKKLGIADENTYINSGVLLLNLAELRRKTNLEDIVANCEMIKDKLLLPDQDLINVLYQGKIKYENSVKYNYQVLGKLKIDKKEMEQIHILHYTGPRKPWTFRGIGQSAMPFWKEYIRQGHYGKFVRVWILGVCYRIYKSIQKM